MNPSISSQYQYSYLQFLEQTYTKIDTNIIAQINSIVENTSWENPNSSIEFNNIAVAAIIEADRHNEDLEMRSLYLEVAFDALNTGYEIDQHPLCAAHLSLLHVMIGETQRALDIAFDSFINTLQSAYENGDNPSEYLVYHFPNRECLQTLYQQNSHQQALVVLNHVLERSQLVFYSNISRRFLQLAIHTLPNSYQIELKLGISSFMAQEWEGIIHLHRSKKLAPESPHIFQALYLAYRNLNQVEKAKYWLTSGQKFYQQNPQSLEWKWTQLSWDTPFTYLPFQGLTIAVEPSLSSIVTSVLLAEGQWFEQEMEFWCNYIQAGMTVIDIGANVGVYTFSAALKVGSQGKVIAIEPFSNCVNYLEKTCQENHLSQVVIHRAAASNCNSTVKLLLHTASELNEVISSDTQNITEGSFEEVPCLTLDHLIAEQQLERVDILKIDAENHELAVLEGSKNLLLKFAPVILYENIAGSKGSNYQVAEYLVNLGYQLFRYQPYLQQLIPITSPEEIEGNLNLIAFPLQK